MLRVRVLRLWREEVIGFADALVRWGYVTPLQKEPNWRSGDRAALQFTSVTPSNTNQCQSGRAERHITLQLVWFVTSTGVILVWMYYPQENVVSDLGIEIGTYVVKSQKKHRDCWPRRVQESVPTAASSSQPGAEEEHLTGDFCKWSFCQNCRAKGKTYF